MSEGTHASGAGSPMTPERLARIRALFDAALELTVDARVPFLRQSCGEDNALQAEVESLLDALDRGDTSWERPLGTALADAMAGGGDAAWVGTRVGSYALTRLIGVGGMGAVYEGVRDDDQFQKRVALKFLRRGHEGDLAIRRFRYERQILANLNHKNIAALLDGGVTPDGQPYIVMEYVDGRPITNYAAAHQLPLRARLQLLRQVCAAVQHAHQNLVVHRDLKPGNILVAADGTVKLLDFGIARLLREGEGADQLPPTQGGLHAFTPEFASPEQVRGLPVATPGDIYSLGVIACELLSGHRPFTFEGQLFAEIQAQICTAPPPPPSALITTADVPQFGDTTLSRLRRQLTGDLDAIVLQALRKEPERRYASAEQFAADLQRHVEGRPVSAQRDTLRYRTAKFLRRRRLEVAAGTLVAASLVGGIVATSRQARRAEIERAKTEQVNEFLATMLAAVDPGNSGRDVTVAQVLSRAARDIDQQQLDPEIEAQIRHTLGQTYVELGLADSAATHIKRAVELRTRVYGKYDNRTSMSMSYLAGVSEARGAFAEAESLGYIVLDVQRRLKPQQPSELASALNNVARFLEQQGRLKDALQYKLESAAVRRASTDSASLEALPYSLHGLSVSYSYLGDFAKADSFAREGLAAEARMHGLRSRNYGNLLVNLANVHDGLGRQEAADTAMRAAIDVLRESLGPDHPDYIAAHGNWAALRAAANDWPTTEAAARVVVNAIGGPLHDSDQSAAVALQQLGFALAARGANTGADSAFRRSLELRRKYLPPEHWALASSEAALGQHLAMTGRTAEGEPMLRAAYATLVEARGADAEISKRTARWMAQVMEKMGRAGEAERWKDKGGRETGDGRRE